MGSYMVYMLEKKIVFTASPKTASGLESMGFTRILYVDGSISGGHNVTVMSGRDWEEAIRRSERNPQ